MKKISVKTYKGIDYIRLSSLPPAQSESLKQTLNERTLIKILMNDVVLSDCVLYSAYEEWFATQRAEPEIVLAHKTSPNYNKPVTLA
jgi:hypothetical protein